MGNIWFTSDHHFGHANIIKYCDRPRPTPAEMDALMIERWQEYVRETDDVYVIGDFVWNGSREYVEGIMEQLPGFKHLIWGNHDARFRKKQWFLDLWQSTSDLKTVKVKLPDGTPKQIVLCHYAMRVWDRSFHGSWHLYGHSHGTLEGTKASMDVGVDAHDYYPVSLDYVIGSFT